MTTTNSTKKNKKRTGENPVLENGVRILNSSQRDALMEIIEDLEESKTRRICRVIYGEVGSGKTIVALLAAHYCQNTLHGKAAFMCPTAALAKQQHAELNRLRGRPPGDTRHADTAIILSQQKKRDKEIQRNRVADKHRACIAIGTNALTNCRFEDLRLCIIDEQQKFGTATRDAITNMMGEKKGLTIMLTATPIPRTVGQVLLGMGIGNGSDVQETDEDDKELPRISQIDKRDEGKRKAVTKILFDHEKEKTTNSIQDRINKHSIRYGMISILVVPAIESADKSLVDIEWVTEKLLKKHNDRVVCIHGKMKEKEKIEGIAKLQNGKKNILVCTSIIEVGIHLPRANLIVIFQCDRFGVAQIHQLRGRIGRTREGIPKGAPKPECILVAPNKKKMKQKATERTENISRGDNEGIDLAVGDAIRRGPGDIFGTAQHGYTMTEEKGVE